MPILFIIQLMILNWLTKRQSFIQCKLILSPTILPNYHNIDGCELNIPMQLNQNKNKLDIQ